MAIQTLVVNPAFTCLVILWSQLWQTPLISSRLTLNISLIEEPKTSACAVLNCSANFPYVHDSIPVRYMEISGSSIIKSEHHIMALHDRTGTRHGKALYRTYYEASHDYAFLQFSISNYFECYTTKFTCNISYRKPNGGFMNEITTFMPDFRLDDHLLNVIKYTAKESFAKLSRLDAAARLLQERFVDLPAVDDNVNAVLRVIEPNDCIKKMHYYFDRTIVNMPGYPRVMCDTVSDGGGWVIFLRRMNGRLSMTTRLDDYKKGFGQPESDYWWGLDHLVKLLHANHGHDLRIDATFEGQSYYAMYGGMTLTNDYQMRLGTFLGGKDPFKVHTEINVWHFDADFNNYQSCATKSGGAFWFRGNAYCKKYINPSGRWNGTDYPLFWEGVTPPGKGLDSVEVKVRLSRAFN